MSEIDATVPEALEHVATAIPRQREMVLNRPGNINWAGERGAFPGCRLVEFTSDGAYGLSDEDATTLVAQSGSMRRDAASLANLYFKHRANLLVVNTWVDSGGSFWVLITNQMEGDELDDFQEYSRFVSEHMEEYRTKRDLRKRKVDEDKLAQEADDKALIELGKKEKAGNFVKRARDAEEEIERVKKENIKLKARLAKLEK